MLRDLAGRTFLFVLAHLSVPMFLSLENVRREIFARSSGGTLHAQLLCAQAPSRWSGWAMRRPTVSSATAPSVPHPVLHTLARVGTHSLNLGVGGGHRVSRPAPLPGPRRTPRPLSRANSSVVTGGMTIKADSLLNPKLEKYISYCTLSDSTFMFD